MILMLLFVFLGTGPIVGKTTRGAIKKQIVLYYTPFNLATYRRISTRNIELEVYHICFLAQKDPRVRTLRKIFRNVSPSEYGDAPARLKIVGLFDKPVFVARDMTCIVNQKSGVLSEKKFLQLKRLMKNICKKSESD